MRYDFVNWLSDNHKTISILWDGITLTTQLFLGAFFPTDIDLSTELSNSSGYYAEEELDAEEMYDFVSDASDAMDQDDEEEEDEEEVVQEEEEIVYMIDDAPDIDVEENETETIIDEIEEVDEIQDEDYSTDVEVLEEEEVTETEEETVSTEEAMELFESYYYSHGQNQELSEEISAY